MNHKILVKLKIGQINSEKCVWVRTHEQKIASTLKREDLWRVGLAHKMFLRRKLLSLIRPKESHSVLFSQGRRREAYNRWLCLPPNTLGADVRPCVWPESHSSASVPPEAVPLQPPRCPPSADLAG